MARQYQESVEKAVRTWEAAPLHVKTMAAAYMVPILEALRDMAEALDKLERGSK